MPNLSLGVVASAMVPFSPSDLSPILWLDASDSSSITSSSGNVSQWNDKSGNGYHVSQATSASQPKTGTISLNGRNVIDFDGTNHYLSRETPTAIGKNVSGMTIYAVVAYDNNSATTVAMAAATGSSSPVNNRFIVSMNSSAQMVLQGRTLDSDSTASATSSTLSFSTWYIQTGVYDYTNTDLYQYVNNSLNGSNTSFQTATTTSNTDSYRLVVGANQTYASKMNGQIAELLIFHSAHSSTTRTLVVDYLDGKWGT